MPSFLPGSTNVYIDAVLTGISLQWAQDQNDLVFPRIMSRVGVPVMQQTGKYPEFDREYWNRIEVDKRAAGTPSARAGFSVNFTGSFDVPVYALETTLDEQTLANQFPTLNLQEAAVAWLTQQHMLRAEKELAALTLGGTWTGSSNDGTPSTKWDTSSGTPVNDIKVVSLDIKKATGKKPNVIIAGPYADLALRESDDIKNRAVQTQNLTSSPLSDAQIATVLGVDEYYVLDAIENTAAEGQTESNAHLGDEDALWIGYLPPRPMLNMPTAFYNFVWEFMPGVNQMGMAMDRYYEDRVSTDVYRGQQAIQMKQVSPLLGGLFTAVDT